MARTPGFIQPQVAAECTSKGFSLSHDTIMHLDTIVSPPESPTTHVQGVGVVPISSTQVGLGLSTQSKMLNSN